MIGRAPHSRSDGDTGGQATQAGLARKLSIDTVWMVLPVAFAFAYAASMPIAPSDVFYMMLNGRLIAEDGQFPLTASPFSFAIDQQPFYNQPWISEVLLWFANRLGGYPAIILLHALVVAVAFACLGWLARHEGASARTAALLTLLSLAVCATNLSIRPQSYALLTFLAGLALVRRSRPGQYWSLAAMFVASAVWANLHGSFFLATGLAGLQLVGATLEERSLTTARVRHLAWLTAAALAGTLVNPVGPFVWAYAWRVATDPTVRTAIQEWEPATLGNLTGQLAAAASAVTLLVVIVSRRWPAPSNLLVFALLGLAGLMAQRSIMWWGLALAPLLSSQVRSAPGQMTPAAPRRNLPVVNGTALAVVALVTLLSVPWLRGVNPLLPPALRSYLSDDHPQGAVSYLQQLPARGRLFARMEWGGYVAWSLWPNVQVYLDARIEQRAPEVWQDYFQILGARAGWQQRLDRIRPDYVLVDRKNHPDLASAMRADSAWNLRYEDGLSLLFARAQAS